MERTKEEDVTLTPEVLPKAASDARLRGPRLCSTSRRGRRE